MDHKEWYDCGRQIGDLVQKAIDSNNYQSLSQSIADTVNDTVNSIQDSIRESQEAQRRKFVEDQKGTTYKAQGNAYAQSRTQANVNDVMDSLRGGRKADADAKSRQINRDFKGIFSMVAGYGAAIASGIVGLIFVFLFAASGWGVFGIPAFLFIVLAAIFAFVGARGGSYRSQTKKLQQYLKVMNGRDTVTLQELANGTGQSVKEVKKDIRNMIRANMFDTPAYLDDQETTLMTSREAWKQYQDTMAAYRQRQAQADAQARASASSANAGAARSQSRQQGTSGNGQASAAAGNTRDMSAYSEETKKILQEGREFTQHIHECNDRIPDPVMSQKLDRLEQTVTRIFRQVADQPDTAPDLHRMMNYYLPITRKLVDAYADLDSQHLNGENATKTKDEIEKSLDTINAAFETFLDSFYQDTAWDISSDIYTLKTMMARDGLTGGDFTRTRSVGKDLNRTPAQEIPGQDAAADESDSADAQKKNSREAAPHRSGSTKETPSHQEKTAGPTGTAAQAASGGSTVHLEFGSGAAAAASEERKS